MRAQRLLVIGAAVFASLAVLAFALGQRQFAGESSRCDSELRKEADQARRNGSRGFLESCQASSGPWFPIGTGTLVAAGVMVIVRQRVEGEDA